MATRLHSKSSVSGIINRLTQLATDYPTYCSLHEYSPTTVGHSSTTHEGRKLYYIKIANGSGPNRLSILLVGGIHAREIAPPSALVNFAEDLLKSFKSSSPITVGAFVDTRPTPDVTYPQYLIPKGDVAQIVERLDLYIAPVANPDGREFVLSPTGHKFWRKNRAPVPIGTATCPPLPTGNPPDEYPNDPIGVDLNRNFDILWDHNTHYSPAGSATVSVSSDRCDLEQQYRGPGPGPATEPETQFIQWLIDTKKIQFYIDVHSFGPLVLYPWGIEENQSNDPTQNFRNDPVNWDRGGPHGGRDGTAGTSYREYFPNDPPEMLLKKHMDLAKSMKERILNRAGAGNIATSKYIDQQSVGLYPTTGASDDYAFSRQFVASGNPPPVYAFTLESGSAADDGFHPVAVYRKVEREIYASLWAFLSFAAKWHAPPASSTGSKWCFVATATFGSLEHRHVRFLRDIRDNTMKSTPLGRQFMAVVEGVYLSFSPQAAEYLEKHSFLRSLARAWLVLPLVWQIRGCVWVARLISDRNSRVTALVALFSGICLAHVGVVAGAIILLLRALGILG